MIKNRSNALLARFVFIFMATFVAMFFLLNSRYISENFEYWFSDKEIIYNEPITLLPLGEDRKTEPQQSIQIQKPKQVPTLVIDRIGVRTPIVFNVPSDNKSIYNNLEKGVVHYSPTSKPGDKGTSVIVGHSSAYPWYRGQYGSVFALLDKLHAGDRIYVYYPDGRAYTFAVTQSIIFNPLQNDSRLAALERGDGSSVVLVSCWPVGTAYKRIAIHAEMI